MNNNIICPYCYVNSAGEHQEDCPWEFQKVWFANTIPKEEKIKHRLQIEELENRIKILERDNDNLIADNEYYREQIRELENL